MRRGAGERAEAIRAFTFGDWLWVALDAPAQPCWYTPARRANAKRREFRHAIFDASGRALTRGSVSAALAGPAGRKLAVSAGAAVRDVGKQA